TKYYFGFKLATDPNCINSPAFVLTYQSISGLIIGLFFGKAFRYVQKYLKAEHTDLEETK
ncbi:MAG: hypothetical protein KAR79_00760, partial [Simkaniaceae bacterium]|nr:hypothetical protein [Simkaniaceae bacterium]